MGQNDNFPTPGAVLFACNYNRVRSPMAEALLRRVAGDRIFVDSCGLKQESGEGVIDPFVETVMAELGCSMARHHPKSFAQLQDDSFDLVISLTPEAQHHAVELTRGRAVQIEYWPIFDPTLADGTRESRLAAYREVRDALAMRIAERFAQPVKIRRPIDPER
ncbi:MAG: low molecular weight phosphatase family protein [Phenylobacterium sp.]|uniref:arsenate-mycothiol transferase ArsC n=1 Tax=Phenylobacterium sp. TaxID=1871053 RepID=UPI002732B655|nr:low molecular weight phosphatase family protein [Phenylobacterium sp.]MDP3173934.1 low molecular weight phosphatase family protein [Phenylobacterium sp.]